MFEVKRLSISDLILGGVHLKIYFHLERINIL